MYTHINQTQISMINRYVKIMEFRQKWSAAFDSTKNFQSITYPMTIFHVKSVIFERKNLFYFFFFSKITENRKKFIKKFFEFFLIQIPANESEYDVESEKNCHGEIAEPPPSLSPLFPSA